MKTEKKVPLRQNVTIKNTHKLTFKCSNRLMEYWTGLY